MSVYLFVKWLHILSATILFGTGIGIAFFKWITDRSGDVRAIRISAERTVLADWIFTTPAVIVQPLSGLAMAHLAGYSILTGWISYSIFLYAVAGCCWLPVLWLQMRMRASRGWPTMQARLCRRCTGHMRAAGSGSEFPLSWRCWRLLADGGQARL